MYIYIYRESFPGGQWVKNQPAMQDTGDMDSIPGSRKIPWKRKLQPTPVFLPKNSHEQRSLVGYRSKGRKESDMTEPLNTHIDTSVKTYIVSRVLSIHTHLPYLNSIMRKREKCILQLLKHIRICPQCLIDRKVTSKTQKETRQVHYCLLPCKDPGNFKVIFTLTVNTRAYPFSLSVKMRLYRLLLLVVFKLQASTNRCS